MKNKKRFRNFGKILLVIALMIIIAIGLATVEIWLTNWLGFIGYVLSTVFRLLGLGFLVFVMLRVFK